MSQYRLAASLAFAVAVWGLNAAPGFAQVPPEPGGSYPSAANGQRDTTASTGCLIAAPGTRDRVATENSPSNFGSSDSAAGYSQYAAAAVGTSNGELTAAQKGEPVGAGGTSGGSASRFANARTNASDIALMSASGPVGGCPSTPSLAGRRPIQADFLQALRDCR
jgi:hypothetical protein